MYSRVMTGLTRPVTHGTALVNMRTAPLSSGYPLPDVGVITGGPFDQSTDDEDVHVPDGGSTDGSTDAGDGGTDPQGYFEWMQVFEQYLDMANALANMFGYNYDGDNGGEIVRQLAGPGVEPKWARVMIERYVAWLSAHGKLEPRWSAETNHANIWAEDGYNPSDFFDAYLQQYGSTDITTGVSEYPFPQGQTESGTGGGTVGPRPGEHPQGWLGGNQWLPGYGPDMSGKPKPGGSGGGDGKEGSGVTTLALAALAAKALHFI